MSAGHGHVSKVNTKDSAITTKRYPQINEPHGHYPQPSTSVVAALLGG